MTSSDIWKEINIAIGFYSHDAIERQELSLCSEIIEWFVLTFLFFFVQNYEFWISAHTCLSMTSTLSLFHLERFERHNTKRIGDPVLMVNTRC